MMILSVGPAELLIARSRGPSDCKVHWHEAKLSLVSYAFTYLKQLTNNKKNERPWLAALLPYGVTS